MSECLRLGGIDVEELHPWVTAFKKGEALTAEIGFGGEITRVSLLSSETVAGLKNLSSDFHNSFPGFNLNCPLLSANASESAEQLWQGASSPEGEWTTSYHKEDFSRIRRLLGKFPAEEIEAKIGFDDDARLDSMRALLARLHQTTADEFIPGLVRQVIEAANNGNLDQKLAVDILFGKVNKKKDGREHWQITLILNVTDDQFSYSVADPVVIRAASAYLMQNHSVSSESKEDNPFFCALSGKPDTPVAGKMPNHTLPLLGKTYLMSMNADAPCQTRYGHTSTEIFPVGKHSVQNLSDALRFMTEPSREGQTWAGVPSSSGKGKDLCIAYLEENPTAEPHIVGGFAGAIGDSPESVLATYESRTRELFNALKLLPVYSPDHHLRVIALNKIDDGRKQVLFSGRYSIEAFHQGRDRWVASAKDNTPLISFYLPTKKGQKSEPCYGLVPSPAKVMLSFRDQWIKRGQESISVPGIQIARVYALLLEQDAFTEAELLLERLLKLAMPLLIGVKMLRPGNSAKKIEQDNNAKWKALNIIATIGILLFRQNRRKETYMENRDYLLGQFLQFADLLHEQYCLKVRDGEIPPQLIGNAALSMALQNPIRAFEMLTMRMAVYLAWATRCSGESAEPAKSARAELGHISAKLIAFDLKQPVSNNGKAELLLGYLADRKKSQTTGSNNQEEMSK